MGHRPWQLHEAEQFASQRYEWPPMPSMSYEIQTPPAQRSAVNCDRELLLTPPDRIMAPRHMRVAPTQQEHVRCIFPEQDIGVKRFSHHPNEQDLQSGHVERHWRGASSIPSLPKKRLYGELERAEHEAEHALEFPSSQRYHSNSHARAPRGSLFGSLSGDFRHRPMNSNFKRPAGFSNWIG